MMTDAPDPGLTDLLAAHYRTITTAVIYRDGELGGAHRKGFECVCACGDEYMALTQAGDRAEETVLRRADSAHVALVVEQHTNGRIAELREWQIKVATALGMCEEVMGVGYSVANAKDASERAESLTTLELEHIECPVWCYECERMERWQSCTHCNGSGCGPGTASGAYEECEWCAGDGRDHEPDLTARAEKAEAKVARVITALEAAEKSVPDDWGVTYIYTSQLRAALEGEQQ